MLTQAQKDTYEKTGFVVLRGFLSPRIVRDCLDEITAVFLDQAKKMNRLPPAGNDLDDLVRSVMVPGTPERSFVYDFVRNIRPLRVVETLPEVREVLRDLGLEQPICLEIPSLRFDTPGEETFLTKHHQDIRSIRGERCVTVWFPLRPCGPRHGSLAVLEGSHRLGLLKHVIEDRHVRVADLEALPPDRYPRRIVEGDAGDIVFMNSFCVHVSHPNPSDAIKINGQFFYNDARAVRFGDVFESLKSVPDYRAL